MGIVFFKNGFIMSVSSLFDVSHTGIADFDGVSVEDFMQGVIFGKFSIKYFKKCTADVCGDILTVRWIVPGEVSVSSPILTSGYIFWRWRFKFQLMIIPTMQSRS